MPIFGKNVGTVFVFVKYGSHLFKDGLLDIENPIQQKRCEDFLFSIKFCLLTSIPKRHNKAACDKLMNRIMREPLKLAI